MTEEKKQEVPKTPEEEPVTHGFANTKAGQDREEAQRLANVAEKKKEAEIRNASIAKNSKK